MLSEYCDITEVINRISEEDMTFLDMDGTCAQLAEVTTEISEHEHDYRCRLRRLIERLSLNHEIREIRKILGSRELLDLTSAEYAEVFKLMRTQGVYNKLFEAATIVAWARTFHSERAAILGISETLGTGFSESTVKNLLNLHEAFFEILTEDPPLLPDAYLKGLSMGKLYVLSEPGFVGPSKPKWKAVNGRIELQELPHGETRTDPVEYPDKETLRKALKGEVDEVAPAGVGSEEPADAAHAVVYKDYKRKTPGGATKLVKTVNVIPDDVEALDTFRPTQDTTLHVWYEHTEQHDHRYTHRRLTYLDPYTRQSYELTLPDVESTRG
ncbi:MAG TPA: hypothetical protein PLO37_15695 [Candidatus Hydrogenedentes bacterium]|nr:hypothetical protein [Candidatus Hydrogenedentota bacterium]